MAAANFIQNGRFQVRNRTTQSNVSLTQYDYTKVADRWYVHTDCADYETNISLTNDSEYLEVRRVSGTDSDVVRVVQILDTEDSLNIIGNQVNLMFELRSDTVTLGLNLLEIHIVAGEGIDETVDDYFNGAWTNASVIASSITYYGLSPSWVQFNSGYTATWPSSKTQIAIELELEFESTAYPSTDAVQI